jgi:hypothetical protein
MIRLANDEYFILETKGIDSQQNQTKREFLNEWVKAVNTHGGFGRWHWDVSFHPSDLNNLLLKVLISGTIKKEISTHFGDNLKLEKLSKSLVNSIIEKQSYSLNVSDFNGISEKCDCEIEEVFSIIGLLSNPDKQIIKQEFQFINDKETIKVSEVHNKFRKFWKDKSISHKEWLEWAEKIEVKWNVQLDSLNHE